MSFSEDCCYLGVGKVYLKDFNNGCVSDGFGSGFGLQYGHPESMALSTMGDFLGNVSDLTISPTFERRQKIIRSGSFSVPDCSTKIITGVNVSMSVSCVNIENLKRAFCGEIKDYYPEDPNEVKEVCFKPCNGMICDHDCYEFGTPGVDRKSVVITYEDGTPLVLEEDYVVDELCVCFIRDITIADKSFLKVVYTCSNNYSCVDGLTGQGSPVTLTFKGCNVANPGIIYRARLHKINLNPIDSFSFINDDFNDLTFTGSLEPVDKYRLKDSDVSQWFEICRIDTGAKR